MNTIKRLGKGKLTYSVALVTVVWGIVGLVFGLLDDQTAYQTILAGIGVFGFRRAIK